MSLEKASPGTGPAVYVAASPQVTMEIGDNKYADMPDGQMTSTPWWRTRACVIASAVVTCCVIVAVIVTAVMLTKEDSCAVYEFVPREEWGARPPKSPPNPIGATNMTFLHHTAMPPCNTKEQCVLELHDIQDLHMDDNGWDDIGYNFLVGEDGRVYEGRGWLAQGAHAPTYNAISHGVCIMGNYMERMPDLVAIETAQALMRCGVQQGYIQAGYELFGHQDGRCTLCPGDLLYADLQTWPHYSTRNIPVYCPS